MLKSSITTHLSVLKYEFQHFSNPTYSTYLKLLRNPFQTPVEDIEDQLRDKVGKLNNDYLVKDLFTEVSLKPVWNQNGIQLSFSNRKTV